MEDLTSTFFEVFVEELPLLGLEKLGFQIVRQRRPGYVEALFKFLFVGSSLKWAPSFELRGALGLSSFGSKRISEIKLLGWRV